MKYEEFRDPVGLAWRMIRSRDRAAWSALSRKVMGAAAVPVDVVLARAERRLLLDAPPSDAPMLFVVGGPRSGSTFVYQLLADHLPVSFPTNLSALFPRAPIAGQLRFGRRTNRRPHSATAAYYGNTRRLGGVNDAFDIWNRWFGPRRYEASTDLSDADRDDMRRFFDAWRWQFPQPLVNKNNRNSECVSVLAEILPEAHFLVIRRDPLAVLQSLLSARETIQGDVSRRWGLRSRDADGPSQLAAVDAICDQLIDVEERLRVSCTPVPIHRLVSTTYEEICADAASMIEIAAEHLGVTPDLSGLQPITARLADENRPYVEHARQRLKAILPGESEPSGVADR